MRSRLFILTILALLASVHHSFADLRIISAYFGRPNRNVDVRGVIEEYVDQGIYSFRVSGANLGGWQNPGKTDFLRVVYEMNGRRYTTDGMEGQVFTFVGVRSPVTGRPLLPQRATIRINNTTGEQLSAYSIDRYGAWHWQAEISPGRTTTDMGIIGFSWVVINRAGAELGRVTLKRGENRIIVGSTRS
jgi:hypothetical protein